MYNKDRREGGGGVGGIGGPGPAKVLFNVKIVGSLGPGAMKYLGARSGLDGPVYNMKIV